jgi:carbamoyl-phosphate synthase small subunit
MDGILLLDDGTAFPGRGFGHRGTALGEAVFTTSMVGYQEILTDPSYAGQILAMTFPHIGNYGVNPEDVESRGPELSGFVVHDLSSAPSSWRAHGSLPDYLRLHSVVGLAGVDTRTLARTCRTRGTPIAVVSNDGTPLEKLREMLAAFPGIDGEDLTTRVTARAPYTFTGGFTGPDGFVKELMSSCRTVSKPRRVVALDFGLKENILKNLIARGCQVIVVPAYMPLEEILALRPEGVFLSNGPGNPEMARAALPSIRGLAQRLPTFGICFGHQLLALAFGGKTYKLPFGHRGANHPVKNLATGRVEITSHNHGFSVDADHLPSGFDASHVNLNDGTLEGMRHRNLPVFSVQYHPESSPGPHDSLYLFDDFVDAMERFHG